MTSICEKKKLTNILIEFHHFILQKQPPEVFCKKGALKKFAIFTEKHLCWSLCGRSGLQFYQKETPTLMFFCEYCEIFKNTYFEEHLWAAAPCFMKKNRLSWRLNNSSKKILNQWKSLNLQFCKTTCLQRGIHANRIKYQVENCPVLPGRNLIFTCNRRVKFHPDKLGSCNHNLKIFQVIQIIP